VRGSDAQPPAAGGAQIKAGFDDGKELVVTVLKVRGAGARMLAYARDAWRCHQLHLHSAADALACRRVQAMGEEAIHAVKEGGTK
jgi:hypothetical protein